MGTSDRLDLNPLGALRAFLEAVSTPELVVVPGREYRPEQTDGAEQQSPAEEIGSAPAFGVCGVRGEESAKQPTNHEYHEFHRHLSGV
jgi:hypothetical protein